MYVRYSILPHTYSRFTSKHLVTIFSKKTFEYGLLLNTIILEKHIPFSKLAISLFLFARNPTTKMCVSTVRHLFGRNKSWQHTSRVPVLGFSLIYVFSLNLPDLQSSLVCFSQSELCNLLFRRTYICIYDEILVSPQDRYICI